MNTVIHPYRSSRRNHQMMSRRFVHTCATRVTTGVLDWGGHSRNYRKEEDINVRESEDKQEE